MAQNEIQGILLKYRLRDIGPPEISIYENQISVTQTPQCSRCDSHDNNSLQSAYTNYSSSCSSTACSAYVDSNQVHQYDVTDSQVCLTDVAIANSENIIVQAFKIAADLEQ